MAERYLERLKKERGEEVPKTEEECLYCEEFSVKNQTKLTTTGKVILGMFGTLFVGVTAATMPFLTPALRRICLPFVPATPVQVENVLSALKGRSGTLLDIGSGDGRIVLAAAKHGFHANGVELNPWLVLYSRFQAWRHGQRGRATFFTKNLWKTNLGSYDNIVIFGVEPMMAQLEVKLTTELKLDGSVVACRFPLPNWEPIHEIGSGVDTVWFYRHPNEEDSVKLKSGTDRDNLNRNNVNITSGT